jgi:hypothetical protein
LPGELFIGILSTGRVWPFDFRHHRITRPAVPGPSSFAHSGSIDRLAPKGLLNVITFEGSEMKSPAFISELQEKLGAPSSEIIESLRLLKLFAKLAPPQRYEVLQMAERLANDDLPSSEHPLS